MLDDDEAFDRDRRHQRAEHLHITIDIPDLLSAVALVASILRRNGLDEKDLEALGASIEKLRKPVKDLKAAVAAAPLQTP